MTRYDKDSFSIFNVYYNYDTTYNRNLYTGANMFIIKWFMKIKKVYALQSFKLLN